MWLLVPIWDRASPNTDKKRLTQVGGPAPLLAKELTHFCTHDLENCMIQYTPNFCWPLREEIVVVQSLSHVQLFCNPMDCSPPGYS